MWAWKCAIRPSKTNTKFKTELATFFFCQINRKGNATHVGVKVNLIVFLGKGIKQSSKMTSDRHGHDVQYNAFTSSSTTKGVHTAASYKHLSLIDKEEVRRHIWSIFVSCIWSSFP